MWVVVMGVLVVVLVVLVVVAVEVPPVDDSVVLLVRVELEI